YFVKWYFTAQEDRRDRLRAEWEFANFAWQQGLRQIAKPVACSAEHRIGIFEFLGGKRLTPSEVNLSHVREAIDFLLDLNRNRFLRGDSYELPFASESCFSISAHLNCVQGRVQRLVSGVQQLPIS